jgi:hypothetical protein
VTPSRHDHYEAVPPTVMLSTRKVGWPTPTGTLCPSLPHTPTPSSSEVVADHRHAREHFRAGADQGRALHRRVTLPSSMR